ncbi:hypothetical protein T440DRAFT_473083 [Plenodomus tracheiphilus IPT5]|uniref:Uncharacterized protein n=1 Tax=Plenodomus tracheiphilus IPT5 TaxID=1408161 RepID=A0A6A7ARX6_9PLEO|nr:hypothetical protein T440DRAFT_473083 [Plenodomus tracheiphilus IPT5]
MGSIMKLAHVGAMAMASSCGRHTGQRIVEPFAVRLGQRSETRYRMAGKPHGVSAFGEQLTLWRPEMELYGILYF